MIVERDDEGGACVDFDAEELELFLLYLTTNTPTTREALHQTDPEKVRGMRSLTKALRRLLQGTRVGRWNIRGRDQTEEETAR